jgi:hypothetical protein
MQKEKIKGSFGELNISTNFFIQLIHIETRTQYHQSINRTSDSLRIHRDEIISSIDSLFRPNRRLFRTMLVPFIHVIVRD